MHDRPRILEFLRTTTDAAADQAMATALPHAAPLLQLEILDMLLDRERDEGLARVPELYDRLTEAGQARVVAGCAKLFPALRGAIRSPDTQTRANALAIVRRTATPRLAWLASLAIHDGAAKIRAEAAETLRRMTEIHLEAAGNTEQEIGGNDPGHEAEGDREGSPSQRCTTEEREFLLTALREALAGFESHHRPEVLEAAMWLADALDDALFQGATLLRGKLTHAMLEIIGDRLRPEMAPFVYVALAHAPLRRRIVALLASCRDTAFFVAFIRRSWLGLDPDIRRHLATVRSLEWLASGFEAAFALPPDVSALVPRWLLDLGIPIEQKIAVLSNLLLVEDELTNRRAAWALTRLHVPAADAALHRAAEHEHAAVRAVARREIEFRRRRAPRLSHALRKDRPAEWARLLDSAGLSESFDDFWQNFERIGPDLAASAGRHAIEFVGGLSVHLRARLMDALPSERVRALRLTLTLGLATHFSSEVFGLCNDPSAEVRAAAMQTLADIGDTTARRILERAVVHDCPSVQARAIEALDTIGAMRSPGILIPLLDGADAHVRGAAVRVLLKLHVPRAAATLVAMLRDRRVEHRCTALWVIDQLHLATLAARVEEMAGNDPDPRIARTARQVLRRLQGARSLEIVPAAVPAEESHTA